MHPSPSFLSWRTLLLLSLLGIGYPAEVLDVDDNYAEEVYSENLPMEALPAVEVTPRPDQVVCVASPRSETPALARWTTAAARRLAPGRWGLPSRALVTFPRRMLSAPTNPAGTPPAPTLHV